MGRGGRRFAGARGACRFAGAMGLAHRLALHHCIDGRDYGTARDLAVGLEGTRLVSFRVNTSRTTLGQLPMASQLEHVTVLINPNLRTFTTVEAGQRRWTLIRVAEASLSVLGSRTQE